MASWGVFQKDFDLAMSGRDLWLKIKKQSCFVSEQDCIVIFPLRNCELNFIALQELDEYMDRKYLKKAVIVFHNYINTANVRHHNITFECSKNEIDALLKYYRLMQFTKNIIVISTENPYGNTNIVGYEDITMRDYVKDALYV